MDIGSVFITGAAGFIGGTLAARYRHAGVEVRGLDAQANEAMGIVAGDVSEAGEWMDHAAGCDLVVHTAAIVNNSAPLQRCWEVNVAGTRRAIEAAIAGGSGRVVHLSSVRAFSDLDFPDGVEESHPVRPDGHRYVDTKVASEQVALQAHGAGEVDVTVIRPGDVYGPGSIPWTLWPVTGMTTGSFFVPNDGQGIFSPVYVDNLVDAITAAAVNPAAAGQVLTVTDGVGVTNAEFFGRYAAMLGIDLPMLPAEEIRRRFGEMEAADVAAGRPPGLNAETVDYFLRTGTYSIAKARRLLGYEPRVHLDEGMAQTETWLRTVGTRAGLMVTEAMGDVLPAAAAIALSPFPIIAIVVVLGAPHARRNGVLFASGWLVGLTALSAVATVLAGPTDDPDSAVAAIMGLVRVAIGVACLVLAARTWIGRPRSADEVVMPKWMASVESASPGRSFGIGAALGGANPKNIALTVAAATSIAELGLDETDTVVATAVFVLLASASVVGAVLAQVVAGDRVAGGLASVKEFMLANNAAITMVILVLIGFKIGGDGLAALGR